MEGRGQAVAVGGIAHRARPMPSHLFRAINALLTILTYTSSHNTRHMTHDTHRVMRINVMQPSTMSTQIAKFVVGLGDKVAPTDIEEGMRVGVDRTKYQIQIPLPPKIDPSVTMMTVEEKPDITYRCVRVCVCVCVRARVGVSAWGCRGRGAPACADCSVCCAKGAYWVERWVGRRWGSGVAGKQDGAVPTAPALSPPVPSAVALRLPAVYHSLSLHDCDSPLCYATVPCYAFTS